MEIKTIAVIGAGPAGRRIAYLGVIAGFSTILEDMSARRLQDGWNWIRESLEEDMAGGTITAQQKNRAIARLSLAHCVEDASREADLVIEAACEEMELKLEVFTLLDKFAKPGSIFASNTSSLPISEIAAITFRPEKCIGMHFVNSVSRVDSLELICASETSRDTTETCQEVGRRMGKNIVMVRESAELSTWPHSELK